MCQSIKNSLFHLLIRVGWTSCFLASFPIVLHSLKASKTTFDLKRAVKFRLLCFVMMQVI